MMGFPRWFKGITPATLTVSCRTTGRFNLDQALSEPSELCCVKLERGRDCPNLMFMSNSA